jgi:hypothetical protein
MSSSPRPCGFAPIPVLAGALVALAWSGQAARAQEQQGGDPSPPALEGPIEPYGAPAPAPAPAAAVPSSQVFISTAAPAQPAAVAAAPTEADAAREERAANKPHADRVLHGFRIGYMYVNNFDKPTDPDDPKSSLKERFDMRSPNIFLIGYELERRLVGHSWLDIVLVGNVMVGGLEQSKFFPSANGLLGFEFDRSFQVGVGPNLTPEKDKVAHILFGAGWTPLVGSFHVPVHAFYIPDVDKVWRAGMTVGVNW